MNADMVVAGKYLPEARSAYVSDIRRCVQSQAEALHTWTLEIGKTLTELRESCRSDSRLWTSLFPTSQVEASDEKKLPFSRATAHKLMAIYRNEALRVSHAKHQLPADYESLYQLSRVPAEKLASVLESGKIGAHSTRIEVRRIANSLDPKNASVYRPSGPVETADERRERQLYRLKEAWNGASEAARAQFVRIKVKQATKPMPINEPPLIHQECDDCTTDEARWQRSCAGMLGEMLSLRPFWRKEFGQWEHFKATSALVTLAEQAAEELKELAAVIKAARELQE